VIVGGAEKQTEETLTVEQAIAIARDLVDEGLSPTAAAKQAAAETGHRKNEIYKGLVDAE
jgi:16S rRNA (cytidine1402-2'-O)-methyltransferase